MVGRTLDYSSVPTVADLENTNNQKKYTVNNRKSGLRISKALCALMAIGALLLAVLVGLIVFFVIPRSCNGHETDPQTLISDENVYPDESKGESGGVSNSFLSTNYPDERLPKTLEPTHYRIQVMPFLFNQTTHGAVTMTIIAKDDTNEVIFHVKNIEIDKPSVKIRSSGGGTPLPIAEQDYVDGEKYKIILGEHLKRNNVYTLDLLFTGHLDNHLQGFYRSDYVDALSGQVRYLASTQFSPTDARRAFPCFDEPSFKANFTITIARTANMTSISNMPLEKKYQDEAKNGWEWDEYKTTPKMSTYLVAFVVSDLQPYGSSDRLIKVWSRKNFIHQTTYAAELAPKILHFFEDYFTIKFPLDKIDIVGVPDFGFNAMENWGLITFRESSLLYDRRTSDMESKRNIATILSHELAHQWFGNLVTPKWWKDLWLKEGFATYLQYLGVEQAEPSWSITQEFIMSETNRAFALDALPSSRPISFKVSNNKQIRQTFDELSYGKGACIIRMMNHFLGEGTFKTGLINFLQKYEYGNADSKDLFDTLTEEAHKTGTLEKSLKVGEIMDSWTNQPGFPVVTAIYDTANKKLILSQKRFLFTPNPAVKDSVWWIPISITTDKNKDFNKTTPTIWMKNEQMVTVDLDAPQWYLLNLHATGYYIVNYDEGNWRLLASNILDMPPTIRAQLISDSMDLARANLLDYDIPLKMIAHMGLKDQEIMFVPTYIAFEKLQYLSDILSNTPIFGLFEDYHSTIFKYAYRLILDDHQYDSDVYLKERIRQTVLKWACKKPAAEGSIKAHLIFRDWMEKNLPVPPDMRKVVYCTAIREGTEAEWNFAYHKYLNTPSVAEKDDLLEALGCTTKKWLLSRYLSYLNSNDSSIKIQDASKVFKSIADNNVGSSLAFEFLRGNWDELVDHYGEGFNIISKMVKSLPKYMNTEFQLNELIRFKRDIKHNIGTASQAFDIAIEKVRANVEWMKKNYDSVEKWFNTTKNFYQHL